MFNLALIYSLLVHLQEGGVLALALAFERDSAGQPGSDLRACFLRLEGDAGAAGILAAAAALSAAAADVPAAELRRPKRADAIAS